MSRSDVKTREDLIQSAKMSTLGRTVVEVTHEVNNSIAVISANVEYLMSLAEKEKFSPDVVDSLRAVWEYSNQAGKITQGLMDFSREEAEPQRVDINKAIETTLTFVERPLQKKNINLIRNLDHSIPEIICNRGQLQQVFLNLILNSRDAMPGGGCLRITTRVKGKRFVEITFEDTGCGIPQDKIRRIFGPNATTNKQRRQGSGLGLAICSEIVKMHFGKIEIKSQIGKGVTSSIKLPVK